MHLHCFITTISLSWFQHRDNKSDDTDLRLDHWDAVAAQELNIVAHIDNFLFLYALQHGINNDEGASSSNSGTAKERKIQATAKVRDACKNKKTCYVFLKYVLSTGN